MKTAGKAALFVFAVVTALVVLVGAIFLAITLFSVHPLISLNDADAPYTSIFFCVFSFINVIFLLLLGAATIRLFRRDLRGITLLSLTFKLELIYYITTSLFWLFPDPFGVSAAKATGIGNMGLSPQIFIAYPITGLVAIWILKRLRIWRVESSAAPNDGRAGCIGAIVVALSLCGGILLLPITGRFIYAIGKHTLMREHASFSLPDGIHTIEHSRIGIHPIMAEYSRNVTYVTNGKRGKTTPLKTDTCGGYPINFYLIETSRGPFLRLDDAVSEHLLDVSTQITYRIYRVQGNPYIGELTDEQASAGWSIENDDPSTLSVKIGGIEATPMADLTQNTPEVYIGRIDGKLGRLRFIPATESPEVTIDHLFDR